MVRAQYSCKETVPVKYKILLFKTFYAHSIWQMHKRLFFFLNNFNLLMHCGYCQVSHMRINSLSTHLGHSFFLFRTSLWKGGKNFNKVLVFFELTQCRKEIHRTLKYFLNKIALPLHWSRPNWLSCLADEFAT